MSRFRVLFVMMMVASTLVLVNAGVAKAQSPTPITIPTATSEGCDQVPAYLEVRQQIMNELLVDMEAVFPEVATPIMENGEQLFGAIMSMTPEQAVNLGKAYDAAADKIEKIDPPAVAVFYNTLQVDLYRLSADLFEEVSRSDLSSASDKYNDQLVATGEAIGLAGAAATGVCPAFADVVQFDQTEAAL